MKDLLKKEGRNGGCISNHIVSLFDVTYLHISIICLSFFHSIYKSNYFTFVYRGLLF